MIINDISTVNLHSYKRLFTFGCSFTGYMWPTWADILHKEMPNAKFYNFGKSGGGQLFILSMLVEANQRYNFNKDDLIVVQWSTFFREDRYIRRNWLTPGNIFTQNEYNEDFVKKFVDLRGCFIRDLALITAAKHMLSFLPSSGILLSSIPINGELNKIDHTIMIGDVLTLYKDTIDSLQTPMTEVLRPPGENKIFPWECNINYYDLDQKNPNKLVTDYHPGPILYYDYLKKLKFPVTDISKKYATETENHICNLKTKQEIGSWHTLNSTKNVWEIL